MPLLFMAVILMGIIFIFWIYTIVFPPISNAGGLIRSGLQVGADSISQTPRLNTTSADFNNSVGIAITTVQGTQWFGYGFLFISIIFFFIFASQVRSNPYFIFIWLGLIFVMVIVAMGLSNSYANLSSSSLYSDSNNFNNLINDQLPIILAIVGLVGGALMFILIPKEQEYDIGVASLQ